MYFSLSLLSAFAAVVYGQGQPAPETTTPASPVLNGCSGCFIIANVDQIIFADYTVTQTATAVASQGVGRNGSVVTTSFVQALPQFSFDPNGLLSGQPVTGTYIPLTGTVITIGNTAYTSPTAYNVFTAYTEFQLTQVGDACSTSTFPVQQVAPVQIPLENGGPDAIFDAERQFIAGLPQLSCAAGGAVISRTIPVPATITTTTSTTSGIFRPTPIAASQTGAAATTSSDSGIEISMGPQASGSTTPTQSVVQGGASSFKVFSTSISWGVFAALFILPGLGAWIL